MARRISEMNKALSLSVNIADEALAAALAKAEHAETDGIYHKAGVCHCPVCQWAFEALPADATPAQVEAQRGAYVLRMLNAGRAIQYGCMVCGTRVYADDEPFDIEAYKASKCPLYFQFFVEMDYDEQVSFELQQGASRDTATCKKGEGAWMPCIGGMRSPILRNMHAHKVFGTIEQYEAEGHCEVRCIHVTPIYHHTDGYNERRETIIVPWERTWYQQNANSKMKLYKAEDFCQNVKFIKKVSLAEMKHELAYRKKHNLPLH